MFPARRFDEVELTLSYRAEERYLGDLPHTVPAHLEAQWHMMTGEDSYYCAGNETGEPVAVDHEDDDCRLGAVRGVEPTMLVCLAGSSWPGLAAPAPELG